LPYVINCAALAIHSREHASTTGFALVDVRVAASLLQAAGLPELVAADLDAYEGLAFQLARSPAELGWLRRHLHDARRACPLFDTTRFRHHLEAAHQTMWDIARGGDSPRSFAINAPS
jgi:protein O-GlcNAc transferase